MISSVIISGGGTGGHIFPAIAIGNEIRERYPECKILFVGATGKMEMEKVPLAGFEIIGLPIRGFQRKSLFKNWNLPFKVLKSLWMSINILKKHKPEIVIGVGGYASAAIGKAAQWKKIPTLLQEQNGYAGVTNKILAKQAKSICVAYPKMKRFFPEEKIHLTGNPVRKEIINLPDKANNTYHSFNLDPSKPTILVIGGSLGARTINEAIESNLEWILNEGLQLIWQTGKSYKNEIKPRTGLFKSTFIKEMDQVYSIADLIISRAGAISISELCLVGKPTILIPSPNVAEDHQTKNAEVLETAGAAILLKDKNAKSNLKVALQDLINNPSQQQKLSSNIKNMAQPRAVQKIVDQIKHVVNAAK